MKCINCVVMSVFLIIFSGQTYGWAGPEAVPAASVFEFKPVLEGKYLTHDFIIKNQGDTPLNITDVRPP